MPWQTSSGLSASIYSNGFYQTMNELFSDSEWMMRDDSRLFNNSCLSFSLINNSESVIIRLYRLPVCFTEFARSRFKDRDEERAHLFFRFTHSWAETFFVWAAFINKRLSDWAEFSRSSLLSGPLAWLHFHFSLSTWHFPLSSSFLCVLDLMYGLLSVRSFGI